MIAMMKQAWKQLPAGLFNYSSTGRA